MSEGPTEKRHGFERWVESLKLRTVRPPVTTLGAEHESVPPSLDEAQTVIDQIPKEVIQKLRERESQRARKADDNTAVFVPPPELLLRAKRFDAPPKPTRPSSVPEPHPHTEKPPQPSVRAGGVPSSMAKTPVAAWLAQKALEGLDDEQRTQIMVPRHSLPVSAFIAAPDPRDLPTPVPRATRVLGWLALVILAILAVGIVALSWRS